MASSTSILDYVGRGLHSARPTTPPIAAGATAVYYETDTTNTFIWTGTAWVQVNGGGGGGSSVSMPEIVQQLIYAEGDAVSSSQTYTLFGDTTAGNTLYFLIISGGSSAAGSAALPATAKGFTIVGSVIKDTRQFVLYKKTTTGGSDNAFQLDSGNYYSGGAGFLIEVAGAASETLVANANPSTYMSTGPAIITSPSIIICGIVFYGRSDSVSGGVFHSPMDFQQFYTSASTDYSRFLFKRAWQPGTYMAYYDFGGNVGFPGFAVTISG
jgi:hypothetical protein